MLFTWLEKERRKYHVSIINPFNSSKKFDLSNKNIVYTFASRVDKEIGEKLPIVNLTCNQNYVQYLLGKRFERLVNLKSNEAIVYFFDVYFIVLCFRVPILIILHFVIPSCRDNNVRASFSIHPNFFKSWSAKRRVPFKMNKTFSRFTFPLNRCVYIYIYIQPTRENESSIRAEVIRS